MKAKAGKESSLIPTLRLEKLSNVSAECFSLQRAKVGIRFITLFSVYAGAN